MSTLTKKPASRKVARKVPAKKTAAWFGYGEGTLRVKPGVDLTQPTLPAGKLL